ncbi:oleosin 18 kDa-like [Triticum dicoccoides]|uniref:oleosin 18 kDa-like n=1 Tax=Triticum dicoccoides TaxID=85692 RepID=UPI00188E22A2|nr:oleosin 18 kDa-like [Triticum dicoccoides]
MAEDHRRDRARQRRPGMLVVAALGALGLLALSGTVLAASVAGLAVAAPLLLLASPVLVPAALLAALTATGMTFSGSLAVGATALLSRLGSAVRRAAATPPDYVELGKRRVAEVAGEQTAHIDAGPAISPEQVARSRRPYGGSHAFISY